MTRHQVYSISPPTQWKTHSVLSSLLGVVLSVLIAGVALAQTFSSGSTGANGPFPPVTPPTGTTGMVLDLNTGVVTFQPGGTTATLPNTPAGGFTNGVLNFTTVSVASGITLSFVKNAANTPVTILASGDVTITGSIRVAGENAGVLGRPGRGGPGGFDGGMGGDGVNFTSGTNGVGPGGGGGGGALLIASSGTITLTASGLFTVDA